MDYGQTLDPQILNRTPFALPSLESETEQNQLARLRRAAERKPGSAPIVRIGVPVWGEAKWVGNLYPKGTKSTQFVQAYQKQFQTVEINSSFYAVPAVETFQKWASSVGPEFRFCPKFPKSVSHQIQSPDQRDLENFYRGLEPMRDRIGISYLQLPSTFAPAWGSRQAEALLAFLDSIPRWVKPGVEFRNLRFTNGAHYLLPEWVEALSGRYAATVLVDTPLERAAFHTSLTASRVMVRFLGADLHETDWTRLDEWAERAAIWIQNGLQELYFVVHEPDNFHSPEAAKYLIQKLNQQLALKSIDLKVPEPDLDSNAQGALL